VDRVTSIKEDIMTEIEDGIQRLQRLIEAYKSQKAWNENPYRHGLVNGLILALAIVEDIEPEFMTSKDYLCEKRRGN